MSLESITNGRAEDLMAAINSLPVLATTDEKLLELFRDYIGTAIRQDRCEQGWRDVADMRVCIGMFRPLLTEILKQTEDSCPICHCLWRSASGGQLFPDNRIHCWSFGHFDTPVYKTIEEVTRLQKPPEPRKEEFLVDRSKRTMWPEKGEPPKPGEFKRM